MSNSSLPRSALPRIAPVLWPLLLETLLTTLIGLVGTWLAGRQGDASAAAFGIGHHVWGLLFVCFRMVGAGVTVAVSHQLGARQALAALRVAAASLGGAVWLGGLISALALFFAPEIVQILKTPSSIQREALLFLQWLALCFGLEALSVAFSGVLRAYLHVRSVLVSTLLMHGVHLALAAWWMPTYGLQGFAYALLVSRLFQLMSLTLLWRHFLQGLPALGLIFKPAWHDLAPILRIGVPTFIENLVWTLSFMFSVRVAASFGEKALATHTYVMQIAFVVILIGMALGMAQEIVIGHLIGAGKLKAAQRLGQRALLAGIALTLSLALLMAVLSQPILRLFTQDESIITQASFLIWLGLIVEPGRTVNIMMNDALRAAGDAKFPAQISIPPMVLILGLGSWLLGDYWGLGLTGIWIAYALDEWLRGAINYARWHWRGWVGAAHRLHRDKQRLRLNTARL